MSGDVQPRKRNKDKRPKKKEPTVCDIHLPQKSMKQDDDLDLDETNIHVHKDIKFGGNLASKIFFSLVFGALICMVGILVFEYRGSENGALSTSDSPWSQMLDGWLEDKADSHDSHDDHHSAHDNHDHEDEEDDHDIDEHDEDDHTEDVSGEDDHDNDGDNHNDDHDQLSEEQTEKDDETDSYFSQFVQKYVQSSESDTENSLDEDTGRNLEEEASVFSGFIKKYIYTTESARDEGYDTQDDDDDDKELDESEDETEESDENDETPDDADDIEYKTINRRYSFQHEKDDGRNFDKENLEDDSGEIDDENVSGELENDFNSKERVEDWRKIVYRSPAYRDEEEEDDDVPYESRTPGMEENDPVDKNGSEEPGDDTEGQEDSDENIPEEENENEQVHGDLEGNQNVEEQNGAEIAVKFTVGVALIVVAHVVLVKKWNSDADTIASSTPLPPLALDPPAFIEQIPLISPLEEEKFPPPSLPVDRRATLVEPGEVLPHSDVEESDLGEYEEELSDVESARESTLVTYEYSPADTEEEEEEEEKSDVDTSVPINNNWATVTTTPSLMDSNLENEELVDSEDEIEYSDNEPSLPQARYGGPKSAEEDYLLADITNAEDWGIRHGLDAAEAMYNGSEYAQ